MSAPGTRTLENGARPDAESKLTAEEEKVVLIRKVVGDASNLERLYKVNMVGLLASWKARRSASPEKADEAADNETDGKDNAEGDEPIGLAALLDPTEETSARAKQSITEGPSMLRDFDGNVISRVSPVFIFLTVPCWRGRTDADSEEALIIGQEIPEDHPDAGTFSAGPNLWPKSLPDNDFRIPVMDYQAKMVALVKVLLKILARGLPREWGNPDDCLDEFAEGPPSIPMRLLHYAPQAMRDERQFGVGDHIDFGGLTILLQEAGTEGLEVWYPLTETWIPVPVKEGSYVINMGDMMQKWTAGYYRSARHRVISNGSKRRYSVPFFLNGNLKMKCKTLDGSGVETIVGEHIRNRLIHTMGKTGKALA